MIRHSLAFAGAVASALLALTAGTAAAAGPQPDPPAFGMFGITDLQRAHLHVSLPAVQRHAKKPQPSCTVDVAFVNEDGKAVFMETHTLAPGTTGRAVFDPRPQRDDANNEPLPAVAAAAAPVRHQLRALIMPAGGRESAEACAPLVATVQVDDGDGVPTLTVSPVLSPRDPASGLPTGKRQHKPFVITTGALAIGFGHAARLNVANVSAADGTACTIDWTFVDETGVRNGGRATVAGGQAVHADFAHTDAGRGLAALRSEVTVTEPDSGSCSSDTIIVTLEGFDSALGQSHSIVPAQLIVPAVQ